jgi:hypothetical protein
MAQSQVGRVICRQCDGWYNSECELRDHMQVAHRRFVSESSAFQRGGTQPGSSRSEIETLKGEWTELSVQLRNRVQARFNSEELDIIDRFILLASQRSVFDHVCQ